MESMLYKFTHDLDMQSKFGLRAADAEVLTDASLDIKPIFSLSLMRGIDNPIFHVKSSLGLEVSTLERIF